MSWLYSIVFAGLVISSGDPVVPESCPLPVAEPMAVVAVQSDETEKFEQSYPLSANGRVNVSNVNGSIVVEAWDRNEVRLEATKVAETKEALANVQIKVDSRADSFSVEADHDSWRRDRGDKGWKNYGKLEVQFKLSVPRGAVLDGVETVNGSVTVSNFVNMTKVSAVNGNVNATNLRGTAYLETVNGEVAADFDRLEPGSKISLETVNGKVNLTIPSDANATLKADSLNGNIKNDFGLPVRKGKYVGYDMYGRVGTGDVQIKLESVNGPLTISRKNDGKSVNPATNLLLQKGKDDDGSWDDSSWRPKNDKINKEIAEAMRESARAAGVGLNIAQAELARLAPEIEKIRVESLENFKVIDKEKIQRSIEQGLQKEREALSKMRMINWSGGATFIEKKSNSFPVKGTPKVTVEAKGSSVRIRGWDRPEVKYILTEMDEGRRRTPATVTENVSESTVDLRVTNNAGASRDIYFNGNSDAVRIEVFVPKKTNLKIISNGEIRLDGVSGDIVLSGEDEAIDVRNVEGKLQLQAVDGQVRIIGFNGELDSKTNSGDVYLEGTFSRISGNTSDGTFVLTVPEKYNADVTADVDAITVENLAAPAVIKEGQWRFGSGGPKYDFKVADGGVTFRNSSTLTDTK